MGKSVRFRRKLCGMISSPLDYWVDIFINRTTAKKSCVLSANIFCFEGNNHERYLRKPFESAEMLTQPS